MRRNCPYCFNRFTVYQKGQPVCENRYCTKYLTQTKKKKKVPKLQIVIDSILFLMATTVILAGCGGLYYIIKGITS